MITYGKPQKLEFHGKPSDAYFARVYDSVTGKRSWRATGKTSLLAAREQIRTWELLDAQGGRAKEDVSLRSAISEWLRFKSAKMTRLGHRAYSIYAASWLRHFPERALVRSLTPALIEGYFRKRGLEVSNTTLNKERTQMRQFFKWTRFRGWCDDDPLVTIAKFKEHQREIRALMPAEEAALLRACQEPYEVQNVARRNAGGRGGGVTTPKPSSWKQSFTPPEWLYPLVVLALRTGLRYGSLENLAWSEVDFERKVIRIPPAKMKAREGLTIPLDEEAISLLRSLKARAKSFKVLELTERNNVNKSFQRAVKRARIPDLRFHDLRATFITRCRQAGIDLEVTARLVGHRDVKTTLKFYRRVSEQELHDAIEKKAASQVLEGKKESQS